MVQRISRATRQFFLDKSDGKIVYYHTGIRGGVEAYIAFLLNKTGVYGREKESTYMKKLIVMSMIACMAFSMTACGSKEAPATDAPAAEGTEAPAEGAEEADAAAPAGDKVWIIATDTVFKPFEYTDENGNFVGVDVDILAAVAEDQGFEYDLQSLGFDSAVLAVEAGQADGLIAGASITDKRKESGWLFSEPYFDATQTFAVAEGSDIKSFEDLNGKTVAVKNATEGQTFAEEIKEQYGFEVKVLPDSATMYQEVASGNSAACVEDTPIMEASIKTGNVNLQIVEGMQNEGSSYGFAIMNKDNQKLLDMFNAGLANIKENGTYDEIISKYFN